MNIFFLNCIFRPPDGRFQENYAEKIILPKKNNYYVCIMKLNTDFYTQDATIVAEKLLGKILVRVYDNGETQRYRITETEAYMGAEDKACHASKGRTPRTEIMFAEGSCVYVYLIYGMYWMLNVVTGNPNHPQAVLIRAIDKIVGSGKVGRELKIDRSFYGESLTESARIWIEDAPDEVIFETAPRVGIDYAGDEWKNKPWRFICKQ